MEVIWAPAANADLGRLHRFLADKDPRAAKRIVLTLTHGASHLALHPRLGPRVDHYDPREVRRLLIGRYEMHYEIRGGALYVLRIWHIREDR